MLMMQLRLLTFNMFPRCSMNRTPSCGAGDIESFFKFSISRSSTSFYSHLHHLFCRKLGIGMIVTDHWFPIENTKPMSRIFGRCHPFEVLEAIVLFVSVFMVALRFVWIQTGKRYQNKSMDDGSFGNTTRTTKWNSQVSPFTDVMSAYSPRFPTVGCTFASHSSKIAYGIESFETRYWTPLFNCGRNVVRHTQSFFARLTVQAGAMARTIRQPICLYSGKYGYST